tara:strand:+ start:7192 stop:7815 length:624 start_codon:yes stop_codon:yes gene_type:complete
MTLKLLGSSSGHTALDAPASAGSNTLVLPPNNGTAGQVLQTDGNGNLTWITPNSPAFFAYWNANTTQTISNTTNTAASWLTSEMFDTDSAYDTSNQRFTVPAGKGGKYVINAGCNLYSNGNSLRSAIIRIKLNGSGTWAASQYSLIMNNDENRVRHAQINLNTMLNLAAGDYIELVVYGEVLNNTLYISNDASGVKSNFLSGYKLMV